MKTIKWLLLFAVCIGPNLLAWLILVFMRVFFGGRRFIWRKEMLVLELKEKSWFRRKFYKPFDPVTQKMGWGGTTFGPHACFVNFGETETDVLAHESVHGEQLEAEAIQNGTLAVVAHLVGAPWWLGLGWWMAGGLVAFAAGFITAWLRDEPFYRGSTFEEAAYNMGAACRTNRQIIVSEV